MPSAGFRRLLYHLGNAALLVYLPLFLWRVWPVLPEMVPIHFNFAGDPDRFTEKGFELLLIFGVLPWLLSALCYAWPAFGPWVLRRHPTWVNIPHKAEFLKLPPDKQTGYFLILNEMLAASALCLNLLFASLAHAIVGVATGQFERLPPGMVWPWLGLLVFITVSYGILLMRLPGRLIRAHAAGRGDA